MGWKRVHTALQGVSVLRSRSFRHQVDRCVRAEREENSLHEEQLLLLGNRDQLVELRHIEGKRLLAQNVLPAEKRAFRVLVMERMRRADVDGIDILATSFTLDSHPRSWTYRVGVNLLIRAISLTPLQSPMFRAPRSRITRRTRLEIV
jgi:hypothetical protein